MDDQGEPGSSEVSDSMQSDIGGEEYTSTDQEHHQDGSMLPYVACAILLIILILIAFFALNVRSSEDNLSGGGGGGGRKEDSGNEGGYAKPAPTKAPLLGVEGTEIIRYDDIITLKWSPSKVPADQIKAYQIKILNEKTGVYDLHDSVPNDVFIYLLQHSNAKYLKTCVSALFTNGKEDRCPNAKTDDQFGTGKREDAPGRPRVISADRKNIGIVFAPAYKDDNLKIKHYYIQSKENMGLWKLEKVLEDSEKIPVEAEVKIPKDGTTVSYRIAAVYSNSQLSKFSGPSDPYKVDYKKLTVPNNLYIQVHNYNETSVSVRWGCLSCTSSKTLAYYLRFVKSRKEFKFEPTKDTAEINVDARGDRIEIIAENIVGNSTPVATPEIVDYPLKEQKQTIKSAYFKGINQDGDYVFGVRREKPYLQNERFSLYQLNSGNFKKPVDYEHERNNFIVKQSNVLGQNHMTYWMVQSNKAVKYATEKCTWTLPSKKFLDAHKGSNHFYWFPVVPGVIPADAVYTPGEKKYIVCRVERQTGQMTPGAADCTVDLETGTVDDMSEWLLARVPYKWAPIGAYSNQPLKDSAYVGQEWSYCIYGSYVALSDHPTMPVCNFQIAITGETFRCYEQGPSICYHYKDGASKFGTSGSKWGYVKAKAIKILKADIN